jgi:phosphoglycerol transferase MdoB-like AlkP superfamily enzyme
METIGVLDTSLISPEIVFWVQVKRCFWAYLFPVILGFVNVIAMRIYMQAGVAKNIRPWTAFWCAALASTITLFGWRMAARTISMIPLYGCGVGLAAVVTSRIFAITTRMWHGLRLPGVVWKGDGAAIAALRERMSKLSGGKS